NWDSWIYTMRETTPGIYEFDLPLPPGTYQYAFYNGMNTLVDRTNPIRCYAPDGKEASQITIQ
ncbi:MAG: isoamylase, partial [Treponema sp.]|nr:isoamylase [Treponema sp.]